MDWHPPFDELGKLELIEIYEFYDKPLLFSCKNASDNIFLALLIEEDDMYETWIYASMSKRRFEQIRSGLIDLHDAFFMAEDEMVYEVRIPSYQEKPFEFRHIPSKSLGEDRLPKHGETLDIKTETLAKLEDSIVIKAMQTKRDFIKISLNLSDIMRTEVPIRILSPILYAFQEVVSSIGQAMMGRFTERGAIAQNILEETELLVVNIAAGSFEVELASAATVDIFGESRLGKAMEEILFLLNNSNQEEKLKSHLSNLKIRVIANYLTFLKNVINKVHTTSIEWASPREGNIMSASISSSIATEAIEVIEKSQTERTEEYIITGRLISANIAKRTYEIWTIDAITKEKKEYKGKILNEAMRSISGAVLDKEYIATIRQTNTIKPMTDKVVEKYELIGLEPL